MRIGFEANKYRELTCVDKISSKNTEKPTDINDSLRKSMCVLEAKRTSTDQSVHSCLERALASVVLGPLN